MVVVYGCVFCVVGYIVVVLKKVYVDYVVVDVLCDGELVVDLWFDVVVVFMCVVIVMCGGVFDDVFDVFLVVGFIEVNVFEVVLGVSFVMLCNFVNNLLCNEFNFELVVYWWEFWI